MRYAQELAFPVPSRSRQSCVDQLFNEDEDEAGDAEEPAPSPILEENEWQELLEMSFEEIEEPPPTPPPELPPNPMEDETTEEEIFTPPLPMSGPPPPPPPRQPPGAGAAVTGEIGQFPDAVKTAIEETNPFDDPQRILDRIKSKIGRGDPRDREADPAEEVHGEDEANTQRDDNEDTWSENSDVTIPWLVDSARAIVGRQTSDVRSLSNPHKDDFKAPQLRAQSFGPFCNKIRERFLLLPKVKKAVGKPKSIQKRRRVAFLNALSCY